MAEMQVELDARLAAHVQALVAIDSHDGCGDFTPIVREVHEWLLRHQVDARVLHANGRPMAVYGEVRGEHEGPCYLLNATLDTAPLGDPGSWRHDPLSATIENGWLYGRGSADSKAGVAVFCQIAAELVRQRPARGTLAFVFDVDEHSGAFGGLRHWWEAHGRTLRPSGAMLGYPGNDKIVVGCRGFHRATVTVRGVAAHSGSSRRAGVNAIDRAAALVAQLRAAAEELPPGSAEFAIGPQLTVTRIAGGEGFSSVPDRCEVDVDLRVTPHFTSHHADALLARVCERLDAAHDAPATTIEVHGGWPAYRLGDDAPLVKALSAAARHELGESVPTAVAGPSSVANFLSEQRVPATSGFGVRYRHMHAADECIDLATLAPTFRIYLHTVRQLLA